MKYLSLGWLVLTFTSAMAWAQATAQISGSVKDQSSAVLPGVEVSATHTDTGIVRNAVTNETGSYVLPNLALGSYRLEAVLPGFRTYVQTGITLQVNSSPVINATLDVGQVSEQVEVQANAAMVETRNSGVGVVIENERILQLPLDGRRVTDLIVLTGAAVQTGVTGNRTFGGSSVVSIAGGLLSGTAYTLDGALHIDTFNAQSLPFPFPDALQEFKAESGGLPAQNSKSAAVNVVTKSGTNQFHGDLFEFVRNDLFNARSYFATTQSTLKRNQFGGTVGGPIIKTKLFFFGGYQGTTLRQDPADTRSFIPTPEMLAGDWTAFASPACNSGRQLSLRAPFVNNQIAPASYSKPSVEIVRRVYQEIETPPNACGEVSYGRRNVSKDGLSIGKIDYQHSDRHSLFGRYMIAFFKKPNASAFNNGLLNSSVEGNDNLAQAFAFGSTYLISPNTVNSARLTASRVSVRRIPWPVFNPSDIGINASTGGPNLMSVSISGGFSISAQFLGGEIQFPTTAFGASNDLSLIRGSHQISAGASLSHSGTYAKNWTTYAPAFTFSTSETGSGLSDFMAGKVATMTQGNPGYMPTDQWYPAVYAHDAWRVSRNFTLNYGLRWEPDLPFKLKSDYIYNFDYGRFQQGIKTTQFSKAPAGIYYPGDPGFPDKTGRNSHWLQFAPRAGFAWDVQGDGRTSVRASYGLSYEQLPHWWFQDMLTASPYYNRISLVNPSGGFADPWRDYPGGNPFPIQIDGNTDFILGGDYFSRTFDSRNPNTSAWNLTVQRQVASEWLVSAGYIGSATNHTWETRTLNPALYFYNGTNTCVLPNGTTITGSNGQCSTTANTTQRRQLGLERADGQYFGRVSEFDSNGRQSYHASRISIERRASRGVNIGANHTWSHCIGNAGGVAEGASIDGGYADYNNRTTDRGNCAASRRHTFNLTAVAQSPQFTNATLRAFGSGWTLSAIYRWSTGSYLTVTSGVDRALSGITSQRPDQVLQDVFSDKSADPLAQYLNPAAFAPQALGVLNGSLGRANIVGPGTWQFDTALAREFRISESQKFEIRAEAYNLTNSFRPGSPGTALSSGTFGQIRTSLDPRILQFAAKYVF